VLWGSRSQESTKSVLERAVSRERLFLSAPRPGLGHAPQEVPPSEKSVMRMGIILGARTPGGAAQREERHEDGDHPWGTHPRRCRPARRAS
jgi:hypothetical protein